MTQMILCFFSLMTKNFPMVTSVSIVTIHGDISVSIVTIHGYISVSIVTIDLYAFYRLFVLSDSNEANVPMLLYMNVSIDL